MTTWLWPDHVIGKRESRRLREEHNALVTAAHGVLNCWEHGDLAEAVRLLAALLALLLWYGEDSGGPWAQADAAIAKAEEAS